MEEYTVKISSVNATQQNGNTYEIESETQDNSIFEDYIDIKQYETSEWEDIQPTKNEKFLGSIGSESYIFTAPDGSTIKVTNTDTIQVKYNSQTGEIVVIGANQADINMSKDSSLTVIESSINDINAKSGGETINIQGAHTSVSKINGGVGSQNIFVGKGSNVEKINTGDGDDSVTIDGASAGKLYTGDGNDFVTINNSTIQNNINTGDGNDTVNVQNNSTVKKIKTSFGNDTVNINSSIVDGEVITGWFGEDTVNITDSTVSDDGKIKTGWFSDNTVNVTDSKIDGSITSGLIYDSLEINSTDSFIQKIKGANSDFTTVNSTDSVITGVDSVKNYKNNVTSLDTTQGEFEGYSIVEPKKTKEVLIIQDVAGNTKIVDKERYTYNDSEIIISQKLQSVFEINGNTIWADSNCGEIYTNDNGDIVLNGVNNANITSNGNTNFTALNSYILSHKDIAGNVNYRNCKIESIDIKKEADNAIVTADNTNITSVNINNSSAVIGAINDSIISNIQGMSSQDDTVEVKIQDSNIGDIKLQDKLGIILITLENNKKSTVNEIETQKGTITAKIQKTNILSVLTKEGSIDLTADEGQITNVKNKNKDGSTLISFNNVILDKITSNSQCNINLDGCTVNKKVVASNYEDIITISNDSEIEKLDTKSGYDYLNIEDSNIEKINASGLTDIYASNINKIDAFGDVAILNSKIDKLKADENSDLYIKNSLIEDEIENSANTSEDNIAAEKIQEIENQNIQEVYTLLEELAPSEINGIIQEYPNLSQEEILSKILENPSDNILQIKEQLILQMQGAIKQLGDSIQDDVSSLGLIGGISYLFNNNEKEYLSKKDLLQTAIESNDLLTILNTYTLITEETGDTQLISKTSDSLKYAETLNSDQKKHILQVLDFIGNNLEYQMISQDGKIKDVISYFNKFWDIGTNKNEVISYIETYRKNVADLTAKLDSGELSNAEFAAEYKRITGNDLTKTNVDSLIDTIRGNDKFENIIEDKIADYQSTQTRILQVGEYIITIAAGTAVTFVSGGAAGPAIAATLSSLGRMGVALTATTVSLIAKTAIEATERHTNSIVADDMTPEEVATSAALMYAGCLCGQFGNAVGDYIRGSAPELISKFISSEDMVNIVTKVAGKTLEIASDTGASVLTTSMITGSGEWNEEFMQNLRSEMIGLIQSKITGAYFKSHPELNINTQIYSIRKGLGDVSEAEANTQILKQFGFADGDAAKLSGLTGSEVDTIILLKATNDLCEASLKQHGIDVSKLSAEEKFEQGKIIDDIYANAEKIIQETSDTCSIVAVLNAINEKPMLLQAIANKFEYNAADDTYKFTMFGEEFKIRLNEGDNLLQKAYEAYQIKYGNSQSSAIDAFNEMLDGASDIIVRPNIDNIKILKMYTEDDSSILTFNTTDEIDGISTGHSYTVLSIDDFGNMKLQDPESLEEITLMHSSYENKDCQIQGKTYKDSGIIEDDVEIKLTAGVKTENNDAAIDSASEEKLSLKSKIIQQISESNSEYQFNNKDKEIEELIVGINYVLKRAKQAGIELTEDDILDICKAKDEYSATNIITSLTSMTELPCMGKALVLAQLKNSGLITDEMIENLTGEWSIARGIEACYSPNLGINPNENYFKMLLQTCGFDENKINAIVEMCDVISKGRIPYSDAKNIISNAQTMSSKDLRIEIIIERYKAIFGNEETLINGIRQGIEQEIKQLSMTSSQDYLYGISDILVQIEKFADDYPEIFQLYRDGKIDYIMIAALFGSPKEEINFYTNILQDSDLSKLKLDDMQTLYQLSEPQRNEVINLIKGNKVVNIDDAMNIVVGSAKQAYHRFIDMGMDSITASVMANIKDIDQYSISEIQSIKSILDSIHAEISSDTRISQVVSDYLVKNPNINIGELADYIGNIDFDKLIEIAPVMSQFGPEQFFKFCTYYYADGQKTQFTAEDLALDKDFTAFLMTHYLDAETLTDLLSVYPNTPREVGVIPDGWFENVELSDQAQAQQEIYQAISNFQKNRDINMLSVEMSRITGKKVTIKKLGSGVFGTGYKISMDGAQDMCLKIFKTDSYGLNTSDYHGQHIEVQTGLFVNEHSSDFVKMYFGRVAPNNMSDGFLVTQYLSDDIIPDSSVGNDTDSYDTIFLGFPIWWYIAPTIVNTFLEAHDLTNKKIILFATSGGSGFGRTVENLKKSVSASTQIQEGRLFNNHPTKEELKKWTEGVL